MNPIRLCATRISTSRLEQMLASHRLTEVEKIRPADRLKQAHKNRPGTVAANFTYVTPSNTDKVLRMSGIRADYTMLFFYDPDCSNCREYEQVLSEIPAFLEMQEKGTLHVLAIYPGRRWRRMATQILRDAAGLDCRLEQEGRYPQQAAL